MNGARLQGWVRRMMNWSKRRRGKTFFIERERMSETGEREEKRKRKKKERNII